MNYGVLVRTLSTDLYLSRTGYVGQNCRGKCPRLERSVLRRTGQVHQKKQSRLVYFLQATFADGTLRQVADGKALLEQTGEHHRLRVRACRGFGGLITPAWW